MVADANIEDPVITMNITTAQGSMYGGSFIIMGLTILITTGALIVYTFITSTPDNMKNCEKIIVYNVLLPDLLLGVLLSQIIGPKIITGAWDYSLYLTQWFAFLHTTCVFHPHLAIGYICKIIALSLTDAYRFENANNMKYMSAIVLSTISITVCFCSLPAIEREGYIFVDNWLGPWFNVQYQFGSILMSAALIALILPLHVTSVYHLFEAKRVLKGQGQKVTRRAFDDLNKIIGFSFVTTISFCLIIPVVLVINNIQLAVVIRLMAYFCPVARVLAFLYLCPHFQFGRSVYTDQDIDDLAKLGDEDGEMAPEVLENIIEGDEYVEQE